MSVNIIKEMSLYVRDDGTLLVRHTEPVHIIPMQELRAVITQKQSALKLLPDSYSDNARKIQVLIKPSPSSQYQDLVNTLDEMLINNVRTYAIVDISPQEQKAVEKVM